MTKNAKTRLSIIAASLLFIGAGCFKADVGVTTPPSEPPGTAAGSRIAGNAILAFDQRPGSAVTIGMLATDARAFLVVRESDYASGKVLGTSGLLGPGEVRGTSIALSRPAVDGETLYVTAYADDGDGVFDDGDAPLKDGLGNHLYSVLIIDAEAPAEPPEAAL